MGFGVTRSRFGAPNASVARADREAQTGRLGEGKRGCPVRSTDAGELSLELSEMHAADIYGAVRAGRDYFVWGNSPSISLAAWNAALAAGTPQ